MNNAIFINGNMEEIPPSFCKIRDAQDEISDALHRLQLSVGEIEISEESGKTQLVVNIDLLEACHRRIVQNANIIKATYEELIKKGLFREKGQIYRPELFSSPEHQPTSE